MNDPVLAAFLERQYETALALNAGSDVVSLQAMDEPPHVSRYVARFDSPCLVKPPGQEVGEAPDATVGIWFTPEHLRRFDTVKAVQVLAPGFLFHPNIIGPAMCLGHLAPGAGLDDIVYQVYEVLTYQRVTMTEFDALNHEACRWARANQDRFPISTRALKARTLGFEAAESHA